MTGRERLPDRRQNATVDLRHDGLRFTLTVGLDGQGAPKEVFADGLKIGAAMAHLLSDACVVISLALQHGVPPAELRKSLGQVPDVAKGEDAVRPASALGVIIEELDPVTGHG